jgi:hypothetical protein
MTKKKEKRKTIQGHESVNSLKHYLDNAFNENSNNSEPRPVTPNELKSSVQNFIDSNRAALSESLSRAILKNLSPPRKLTKAEVEWVMDLFQLRTSASLASLKNRTS